jgi:hypothetical protein
VDVALVEDAKKNRSTPFSLAKILPPLAATMSNSGAGVSRPRRTVRKDTTLSRAVRPRTAGSKRTAPPSIHTR